MKYLVKAKEKCVYQNTLYKPGEEFTFEAESEKDLPGYVEVIFVHRMVTENLQGNAAGEIPNGAALKTDNTGDENPPVPETPNAPEKPAGAEDPGTDKKEDKAKNTKVKNKKN